MAVRVLAVEGRRERAIRERGRHAHELPEAIGPQLTHAIEFLGDEARTGHQIRQQRERAIPELRERRQREERGIGPDFGVELGPDARQRLVQLERAEIARALVQHVARQRREARASGRIGRRPDTHEQHHGLHGQVAVLDRPQLETVREPCLPDRRELEGLVDAERGHPRAVGHQCTLAATESGNTRPVCPVGTTLTDTRASGRR